MELCKEYKSMCFNESSEKLTEKFELDFQENLPQYLDDIDKVIKCSVSNVVTNYDVSDSRLTIHGKTIICLTYLNKDLCTLSSIFEEEFTKCLDVDNGDFVCFADIKLYTKYSNFRLINQRRIDIHTSLCAQICIYRKNTGKCLTECKNAFTRQISLSCLMNKNAGVCSLEFDENFSISASGSQIKNIVNSYGVCYPEETKIIKDKMLVKLKVEISVLYVSDSNSIEKCMHSFSLSKIVDVSDSGEDDKALISAAISGIYVKTRANSDNVLNEIELVGTVAVNYLICSVAQHNFITDSYMSRFNTEVSREKLSVKESPKFYNDDRSDELTFDSDKNIIEILDLRPTIESCSVKESVMTLSVNLSFLYYDDASQLCFFEKSAQLSFKLCDEAFDGEGTANLISYDFVIKSADKIALRLNYTYQAYLYRVKNINYLTDIEASGEKNNLNLPELTLYFANKNEDIWDIAKTFSTDMSLIMEENNLSSQIIENKMVLLVPGM
ncbi:MAG: SPOCS domain-containing protein [Eubacterium sp.]